MVKKKTKKEKEVKLVKVDLACGENKQQGFIGVDKFKTKSADIVFDLQSGKKWPFKDNSVDEVFCSHYIEHVSDLCFFWEELYRILKVGGTATIIAPYAWNNRAWQDPTHVRGIVAESFMYLDKNFRAANKLEHYLADVDFEYNVIYTGIDAKWANRTEEARAEAVKYYVNVVQDIQANLKKR